MKSLVEQTKIAEKDRATARNQMIVQYLPLVKYTLERMNLFIPPTIDKEDLIEAGILGLIDAVEKFDPTKNCDFATYAKFRIRGAILDELRNLDWMPKSLRQKARQLEDVYLALEQKLGYPPSDKEVAKALGINDEKYHKLIQKLKGVSIIYLEDLLNVEMERGNISDIVADQNVESAIENVYSKEIVSILSQAIAELPEKERLVISLYYYNGLTLREIGEVIGVAKSTVSELQTKALLRLRAKLRYRLRERQR